jgi:hypothetical protein
MDLSNKEKTIKTALAVTAAAWLLAAFIIAPCAAEVNDTELIAGVLDALPDEYASVSLLDETMCFMGTHGHQDSGKCSIAVSYVLPREVTDLSDLGCELLERTRLK